MNQNSDDQQLRQLFTEQRQADARQAPAFDAVVARARVQPGPAPRPTRGPLWLRPAIACAVIAVVLVVFVVDRQPEEQLVAEVLDWESPTAFLLESSLGSPADLTASIAEIVPQLSPTTTATERITP